MNKQPRVEKFTDLPSGEQQRVRIIAAQLGQFAFRHAAAVLVAPPPGSVGGRISNGTGFVLELDGTRYLGTAWHVVKSWLDRTDAGEQLLFQAGNADVPPRGRITWHDAVDDIAFIRLTEDEADRTGIPAFTPASGWPPPRPQPGDLVLVSGYPGVLREYPDGESIDFGSFNGGLSVTSAGERHISCQFQRADWVSSEGGQILPEHADIGGMSGAPVMLVSKLCYPLVGMVCEHHHGFEIMRITTFAHLPASLA